MTTLLWIIFVVCALFVLQRPARRSPLAMPASELDAAVLLRKQRIASSASAKPPQVAPEQQPPQLSAAIGSAAATTPVERVGPANAAETAASHPSDAAFFMPGQCEQAVTSVRTAIERHRAPGDAESLQTAHTQTSMAQAERESDNVRRLLQADGMLRWRPDPAKLPPQRPANASMEVLMEHVPIGGHAWLAFGNSGVTEMLMNWCHHVIKLGLGSQMVVAAFDEPLLLQLHARRIPAYNYSGALPATHFRHAPYLFHRMGFLKAELITHVLRTGRHALVSDSDVAWAQDPTPLLNELLALGATLAPSTDCLDVRSDADKTPRRFSAYMCGYNPGNVEPLDVVFNTGVVWFKADAAGIAFAAEWALQTLNLNNPFSDDQGVFNRLIVRGMFPVVAHSADGRVIRAADGLRVAPLPADRFCSGHLVWVQQASEPRQCVSVHATFTEYGDGGKRWRFLEAGLWGLLPAEYYDEGRYLTFVPPEAPPDPQPCAPGEAQYEVGRQKPPCGGEDPHHGLGRKPHQVLGAEAFKRSSRLRANMGLMARQVHALRDALAVARVLNRTLILPHFDCLCDRSEDVQVIPTCTYHGAPMALPMPFKCSQHFVADTHKLQLMSTEPTRFGMQPHKFGGAFTHPLLLRAHSFLDDPRTAAAIKQGVVDVAVGAAGGQGGGGGEVAQLPRGATNVGVKSALERWRDARVLRLSDAEGIFAGWESNKMEATLFTTMMEYYLYRGAWCCSSRGNGNEDGRVYTQTPPPLKLPR